jgi:hypothetical protein
MTAIRTEICRKFVLFREMLEIHDDPNFCLRIACPFDSETIQRRVPAIRAWPLVDCQESSLQEYTRPYVPPLRYRLRMLLRPAPAQ